MLFKRAEGLIIGVLFMSNISNYILFHIKGYEIIVVYIFLLIISIILYFIDYEKRSKYKLKFLLSQIEYMRVEVTIMGNILERLLKNCEFFEEKLEGEE